MKININRHSLLHLLQHPRSRLGVYSLILLVGALFLFNSVRVKNTFTLTRIEQQIALKLQDPNYIAAQKAFKDGLILSKLNTTSQRESIKHYETALQLWQKVGDKAAQSNALVALGQVYSNLGEKQKAGEYYKQALKLRRAVNDKNGQVTVLGHIASLERSQGNLEQSRKRIQDAIVLIEDLRKSYTNTDEQSAYFASVQQYYKFNIDLLMELHKKNPKQSYDAEALYTSERSKARGLVELLKQAKANLCKGIDPELIEAEERLVSRRDDAERLLSHYLNQPQQPVELIEAAQKQIANIIKEQEEINNKIRAQNPDREKVFNPKLGRDILKLPQIQQLLDKDSVLLEYSLGEERSYLWAVTQNSFKSYELPGRQQIEIAVSKFRSGVQIPDSNLPSEVITASNDFSKMIMAPVANKLQGKRLIIVGDGALQDVPFAALPDLNQIRNYQPLMLNHEIISLPSASTLAIQRQKLAKRPLAPKALAIFADPVYSPTDERVTGKPENNQLGPELALQNSDLDNSAKSLKRSGFNRLQGTVTEAQGILNLIPASSRMQAIGFDANYASATSSTLNQFRIIHFATHGFVNYENPELSGIVLSLVDKKGESIPGYLRLGYLFNLDYPAELIVLSACETGLGRDVSGEGLVGLTRGLMYAGGRRLVVSLWNVNDAGTSVLMQEFYKEMLQQNKTPGNALRAAQKKLWENPEWRSPYFWAGFTVQGEWQ
ncbi:TPR domain protein [Calothrix sp. NIES-4071]|nr:TPR domain protein [Calothrix sp. NIES-4071]BAZ63839.1 TPR domain protein [Calothrix sp. NIES-4105]